MWDRPQRRVCPQPRRRSEGETVCVSLKPSRRYAVDCRTSTDQEALRIKDFPECVGRPLETAYRTRIRLLGEGGVGFQKGLEDWGTNLF